MSISIETDAIQLCIPHDVKQIVFGSILYHFLSNNTIEPLKQMEQSYAGFTMNSTREIDGKATCFPGHKTLKGIKINDRNYREEELKVDTNEVESGTLILVPIPVENVPSTPRHHKECLDSIGDVIVGDKNTIYGAGHSVWGDANLIFSNNTEVYGNENTIFGNWCSATGRDIVNFGKNNLITDSDPPKEVPKDVLSRKKVGLRTPIEETKTIYKEVPRVLPRKPTQKEIDLTTLFKKKTQ